jgi:hypothetical protein
MRFKKIAVLFLVLALARPLVAADDSEESGEEVSKVPRISLLTRARNYFEQLKAKLKTYSVNYIPPEVSLNDFEDAKKDFSWETGGYVILKQSNEHAKNGKYSCQALFTVAGDFGDRTATRDPMAPSQPGELLNVTIVSKYSGGYFTSTTLTSLSSPALIPEKAQDLSWKPAMLMGSGTLTSLKVHDWSPYQFLKATVYNPQSKPIVMRIRITDTKSYEYTEKVSLPPLKETLMKIQLSNLVMDRIDPKDIHSFDLSVDTTLEKNDITLYMYNIYLTKTE